jgi:hypothetical protein
MKTLERYIMARIAHCGYRHVRQFCETEPSIAPPTFYKLLRNPDESRGVTRDNLARKLRFRTWEELIDAWQADDVEARLDLPIPPQAPPVPAVTRMHASKASEQQLSPELQRAVSDAILRGLKESDITAAIESLAKKRRERK